MYDVASIFLKGIRGKPKQRCAHRFFEDREKKKKLFMFDSSTVSARHHFSIKNIFSAVFFIIYPTAVPSIFTAMPGIRILS